MPEILVVEDNDELRLIVREALEGRHSVTEAASAEEAFFLLERSHFDLVITDLKLPVKDGISVLEAVKKNSSFCEVVVVTAYGSVERAVEAVKKGAADFITKPFTLEHIRVTADKILSAKIIKEENAYLKGLKRGKIIGGSPAVKELLALCARVAQSEAAVLITGESGTGKELIAEEIHYQSARKEKPIIKVNCGALAPGVLESELFGHEKGAFTDAFAARKGRFELADGGTIFLDEIGDMPLGLQVKLLRVLQERSFERVGGEKTIKTDVRVIAATNKDLKKMVKEGSFREDLFYRINVVEIHAAPLRERKEDIPALAEYFLKKYSEYGGYVVKKISAPALARLVSYNYPGNIRELENIIQRILVTAAGEEVMREDIPYEIGPGTEQEGALGELDAKVAETEKEAVEEALKKTGGNKIKAAGILGISRPTLDAKIKKFGITLK